MPGQALPVGLLGRAEATVGLPPTHLELGRGRENTRKQRARVDWAAGRSESRLWEGACEVRTGADGTEGCPSSPSIPGSLLRLSSDG